MTLKFSISELVDLQKQYDLNLPTTDRGLAARAKQEEWMYEEVAGRGGPSGIKKVYTLPDYVVAELQAKGVLDLLPARTMPASKQPERASSKPFRSYLKTGSSNDVPSFMREMVAHYDDWAEEQDADLIVPVRYHTNVFGSAGNGYELMEEVETEAMWFRQTFFNVLGVPPSRCFCTRVKGDSMHPTLIDRGTVMWQMMTRYQGAGIYLFRQVNELRIKRLQQVNGFTFSIISDNANKDIYPTETLDLRQLEDYEFEIYGKYLWDCAIRP